MLRQDLPHLRLFLSSQFSRVSTFPPGIDARVDEFRAKRARLLGRFRADIIALTDRAKSMRRRQRGETGDA
ncbi:Uncharacterised protein [Klebsiella pneumoniae]|nr:Uncharacterised protein [Klebsiella pneumoniae]